jgi:putative membrane protein insertion efficiency factor
MATSDESEPPDRQLLRASNSIRGGSLAKRLLLALVRGYRLFLSPWLGSSCRFEPTCSAYALQALEAHGAASGARLTLGRLARCNPWCAGGCDPVPSQVRPMFSSLLGRSRSRAQPLAQSGVLSPSRKIKL